MTAKPMICSGTYQITRDLDGMLAVWSQDALIEIGPHSGVWSRESGKIHHVAGFDTLEDGWADMLDGEFEDLKPAGQTIAVVYNGQIRRVES